MIAVLRDSDYTFKVVPFRILSSKAFLGSGMSGIFDVGFGAKSEFIGGGGGGIGTFSIGRGGGGGGIGAF